MARLKPAVLFFFLFFAVDLSFAQHWRQDETLTGEFIYTFGASLPQEDQQLTDEEVVELLLEEARIVFSGMIYGYSIEYRPSDRNREISEFYHLELLAEIPPGDPALSVYDVWNEGPEYHVSMRYDMAEFQRIRRESIASNRLESAAGEGVATVLGGYTQRLEALSEALKSAFINHLKLQTRNKPERGRGEIYLREVPRFFLSAFEYHCFAEIQVNLLEIDSYLVH